MWASDGAISQTMKRNGCDFRASARRTTPRSSAEPDQVHGPPNWCPPGSRPAEHHQTNHQAHSPRPQSSPRAVCPFRGGPTVNGGAGAARYPRAPRSGGGAMRGPPSGATSGSTKAQGRLSQPAAVRQGLTCRAPLRQLFGQRAEYSHGPESRTSGRGSDADDGEMRDRRQG